MGGPSGAPGQMGGPRMTAAGGVPGSLSGPAQAERGRTLRGLHSGCVEVAGSGHCSASDSSRSCMWAESVQVSSLQGAGGKSGGRSKR